MSFDAAYWPGTEPGPSTATDLRALTVKQPWTFAIAEKFKPVENRTRRTNYRGPILLHSSLAFDDGVSLVRYSRDAAIRLDELGGRANFWDARARVRSSMFRPPHPTLALGAIIAVAELVDCHEADGCCQPWGEPGSGVWHWRLDHVQVLAEPVAARGALGFWRPVPDVLAAVRRQLRDLADERLLGEVRDMFEATDPVPAGAFPPLAVIDALADALGGDAA